MRILQVINGLKVGGAERLVYNFARHVHRDHSDIHVEICTVAEIGTLGEELIEKGETVHHLGLGWWNLAKCVWKVRKLILQGDYDIVHAHLFPTGYCVSLGGRFREHPALVYTEHDTWNRRRAIPLLRPIESIIYGGFDQIVAIGEECKANLLSWLPNLSDRLVVIENGVSLSKTYKEDFQLSDPPSLLTVGRLVSKKGIDLAIEAVQVLTREEIPISLTIVGDGPERYKLENQASGLPVEFAGEQDNPLQFMLQSDLLLIPSRWEGFGLVAAEGMGAGIPVLVSDVDALSRIVQDGISGLHVKPDDAYDLAQKIKMALNNENLRRKLSRNGRERVLKNWSINRYINDLISLYTSINNKTTY